MLITPFILSRPCKLCVCVCMGRGGGGEGGRGARGSGGRWWGVVYCFHVVRLSVRANEMGAMWLLSVRVCN